MSKGTCQIIIVSVSDSGFIIVGSRDIVASRLRSSDNETRTGIYATREVEWTIQNTRLNQYFSRTPSPPRSDSLLRSASVCHVATGIYSKGRKATRFRLSVSFNTCLKHTLYLRRCFISWEKSKKFPRLEYKKLRAQRTTWAKTQASLEIMSRC